MIHTDGEIDMAKVTGWLKLAFEFVAFLGFILVILAGYSMYVIAMEPV